jgi:nitrate/TMAO reductase-like tetraheme cytochrome c subunit
MKSPKIGLIVALVVAVAAVGSWYVSQRDAAQPAPTPVAMEPSAPVGGKNLLRSTYDPIHFKPAIETAKDEHCLACHREVLDDKVRETSPAGVKASTSKAWYQQLSTYTGEQDTFHRRHLLTGMAKELMNLSCTTCHQGNDPRDEAQGTSATGTPQTDNGFTLRKVVNVETTCLKCHAPMNTAVMGLPSPWPESKEMFGNSCLTCHAAIRTNRHQVSYLKAEAIEAAGQKNADVCYGCHGGRSWYRMEYPYPRHPWEGMSPEVPDWAKDRPVVSEARFALPANGNQPKQ